MKIVFFLFLVMTIFSCTPILVDTFNSNKIVSSKGEKVYINSINWGVTDDSQLSIISLDSLRLKERDDSLGAIYGLNPFIYKFKNDSLTLFFFNKISYRVSDELNTISIDYKVLDSDEYKIIREKTNEGNEYFSVPIQKKKIYPSNMPKP